MSDADHQPLNPLAWLIAMLVRWRLVIAQRFLVSPAFAAWLDETEALARHGDPIARARLIIVRRRMMAALHDVRTRSGYGYRRRRWEITMRRFERRIASRRRRAVSARVRESLPVANLNPAPP